jgi:hypothetical protein
MIPVSLFLFILLKVLPALLSLLAGGDSKSSGSEGTKEARTDNNNKLTLKRVKVDGKWYNAREGWGSTTGMLELSDSGKITQTTEFIVKEPYIHMNNFYYVHDTAGNKVGEIDINNRGCSGRVSDYEV